ncbi:hypothetical protein ElyMa_000777000 [Elysia marginata]|uniref:DUF4371 domain-containing protein n=1 Tax=Elysia marginata TaxID=1093978 RepID=A0AAV4GWL7_9GAST|nr:hypothetical protein ElyMa_000777000 [Elysia marginata]
MGSLKCIENGSDVSDLEKDVRNSWKWHWLEEECESGRKFSSWCKKFNEPGKCVRIICSKTINYGSSGKKALKLHAENGDHTSRVRGSVMSSKIVSSSGSDGSYNKSLQDKCAEVKSVVGLFLSEHCLPFSLASDLLSFAQRLSKDTVALNSVTLSATSATYNTTHGVAHYVKQSLSDKLKDVFFSMNIDEATTSAGNKILNILVQYYEEDEKRCVVDLLQSRQVNIANSSNLLDAVDDVLSERGLKWDQVVSVLMDNCSALRGVKTGLEAKMRAKNQHLLDISRDTVHMVNNAAKKFFVGLDKDIFSVTELASDLYYDI